MPSTSGSAPVLHRQAADLDARSLDDRQDDDLARAVRVDELVLAAFEAFETCISS